MLGRSEDKRVDPVATGPGPVPVGAGIAEPVGAVPDKPPLVESLAGARVEPEVPPLAAPFPLLVPLLPLPLPPMQMPK